MNDLCSSFAAETAEFNTLCEGTRRLFVPGERRFLTWKSSNKKVATVNRKGVVTGKKLGKATITAKANGVTEKSWFL